MRQLRTSHGLKQKELGSFLGVTYRWVMQLERGALAPPPIDLLKLLGQRLGVSVAVLIGEESQHEDADDGQGGKEGRADGLSGEE